MKTRTKIKSKLATSFSKYFTHAYNNFTLKHVSPHDALPEHTLNKPLSECKVSLLTSAGAHLKSDKPFDVDNPNGDHTIRVIPGDIDEHALNITHIYYDTQHAKVDPSIMFPINQLNRCVTEGMIHTVSNKNIGLNGGILDTTLVESESIPKVTQALSEDQVDVALLVPG